MRVTEQLAIIIFMDYIDSINALSSHIVTEYGPN